MAPLLKARLELAAAALLFSTSGAAIKACSLDGWATAGLRSLVAAGAMLALSPSARGLPGAALLPASAAYAAMMVLFVLATKLTTSAHAILLENTAPVYVLLLGPLLLGEGRRPRDLLCVALGLGGLAVLVSGAPPVQATAPRPALGNLVGAAAGLAWGLTVLGLRWAQSRRGQGDAVVAAGNALAAAAALPLAGPWLGLGLADGLLLLWLGAGQTAFAYLLLNRGLAKVPAFEASLLVLIEPLCNPVWTWLAHGETPGARAALGGLLIAASIGAKALGEPRAPRGLPAVSRD